MCSVCQLQLLLFTLRSITKTDICPFANRRHRVPKPSPSNPQPLEWRRCLATALFGHIKYLCREVAFCDKCAAKIRKTNQENDVSPSNVRVSYRTHPKRSDTNAIQLGNYLHWWSSGYLYLVFLCGISSSINICSQSQPKAWPRPLAPYSSDSLSFPCFRCLSSVNLGRKG